jgi:hypothetical protein
MCDAAQAWQRFEMQMISRIGSSGEEIADEMAFGRSFSS